MILHQKDAENVEIEGRNTKLEMFCSNVLCMVFDYECATWRSEQRTVKLMLIFLPTSVVAL